MFLNIYSFLRSSYEYLWHNHGKTWFHEEESCRCSSWFGSPGCRSSGPTSEATPAPAQEPAVVEAAAVTETPNQEVDVVAVCDALAAKNPEKLNWKSSIVDLLKLLGLDSSLAHRGHLAEELNCPKDLIGGDYSQMNVWLHKEVMKQLCRKRRQSS